MSPGDELFTDADLEPTAEERRAGWRRRLELVVMFLGTGAIALWLGSLAAVRWCAAPALGAALPASLGRSVLGAISGRADGLAIGCGAVLLGTEVVRMFAATAARGALVARFRRLTAIFAAAAAAYVGLAVAPAIARAERGAGDTGGASITALEQRGELVRLGEIGLCALLLGLELASARGRREPSDEGLEAPAPAPPGPAGKAAS